MKTPSLFRSSLVILSLVSMAGSVYAVEGNLSPVPASPVSPSIPVVERTQPLVEVPNGVTDNTAGKTVIVNAYKPTGLSGHLKAAWRRCLELAKIVDREIPNEDMKLIREAREWATKEGLSIGYAGAKAIRDKNISVMRGLFLMLQHKKQLCKKDAGTSTFCINWDFETKIDGNSSWLNIAAATKDFEIMKLVSEASKKSFELPEMNADQISEMGEEKALTYLRTLPNLKISISALVQFIETDKKDLVRFILKKFPEMISQTTEIDTDRGEVKVAPLAVAALANNVEMIQILVREFHAPIDALYRFQDYKQNSTNEFIDYKLSALGFAVRAANSKAVKALLEEGANPDANLEVYYSNDKVTASSTISLYSLLSRRLTSNIADANRIMGESEDLDPAKGIIGKVTSDIEETYKILILAQHPLNPVITTTYTDAKKIPVRIKFSVLDDFGKRVIPIRQTSPDNGYVSSLALSVGSSKYRALFSSVPDHDSVVNRIIKLLRNNGALTAAEQQERDGKKQ